MIRYIFILFILPLIIQGQFDNDNHSAQQSDEKHHAYRMITTDLIVAKGERRIIDFDFEFLEIG
jgi:hypothetical protein